MKEEKGADSPDSAEEGPRLRQAIEFTSSLISLSHSIKVFAVKWQSIRKNLEELNLGLIAAETCDGSDENPAISSLIPSIMETANRCYDLSRRCLELSYSGKLLMQSDLDVISSKFDHHVKNLSEIYSAGILIHGSAIVVSRPDHGASKDDIKFYVSDITTRMKIGDSEMKRQALINLHSGVEEDEEYVKLIGEDNEIVNILISLLDSPEVEIQEGAARIISIISGFDSYRSVLVESGVISRIIQVLESGSEDGKEISAKCLQKLTVNSDNAWSVSAHGGVTALMKICKNSESKAELICSSCGVLRNLVGVEEIKRFMVEESVVSNFIKLIRSSVEVLQINSIEFLQIVALNDESIHKMVVREGGIRALVRVLDPRSSSSYKTKETALRAIEFFCFSSSNHLNILMNSEFFDHLLQLLKNGDVSIQELVLKVSVKLCEISEEAKKVMGEAGFLPELVNILGAKSYETREMAAGALSGLVLVPRNRKKFVQDDRNIEFVLQLLDSDEGNCGNKRLLLSILNSLTGSNSGRRKIVNSGYLKKIEKLAEAEVSDAKKLVRKLSANKFRNMFNFSGIWHSSS